MSEQHETPAIDGDILDAIAQELTDRHTARVEGDITSAAEQAITSAELAESITGEDTAANPKTREAMKVLMRERNIPIVGDHRGNWIPVDGDKVDRKLDELDARIAGIEERKELLADNWSRWNDDGGSHDDVPIAQAVRECVGQGTVGRDELVTRVAERTGESVDAVSDRVDELERNGFIYESGPEGVRLP